MSVKFETVLKQANALPPGERKKLVAALTSSRARTRPIQNGTDDKAVIRELRAWVDETEKSENPKPKSSAKVAESIRKWNDRGYKL